MDHRVTALEKAAIGSRQMERDLDHLKIEVAAVKGLAIEARQEMRDNEKHTRSSLERLHKRLDDLARDQEREHGAKEERAHLQVELEKSEERRAKLERRFLARLAAAAGVFTVVVSVVALFLR